MQIRVGDGHKIEEIKFTGKGCAISQASASMLTELAKGKQLVWVKQVVKEDVFKLLGDPELGPSRVKCALLGMKVLKTGVYDYLGSHYEDSESDGMP
jgi:nitrogen fixation NifU-like protein